MSTRRGLPCVLLAALALAACRDVDGAGPQAGPKESGGTTTVAGPVSKVDLLFVIDNSRSMGDKQALLGAAVPELVERLVTPSCVDDAGQPTGVRADPAAEAGKECPAGKPAHAPIVDIHVGVVSSSMGGFGSDACPADAPNPTDPTLNSHNDDRGRLINRSGPRETPIANASPSSFLSWFPSVKRNESKTASPGSTPYTALGDLDGAFSGLVTGVKEYGCGFEATLESWYHFLVQPDPYEKIVREGNIANYAGIDQTILQQRADFLRPDSLVAIVLLTDEDDSSVDPLALGGQGWAFMNATFPASARVAGAQRAPSRGGSTAPKGTTACDTDPGSPDCTSCGFKDHPKVQSDPKCKENEGFYAKGDDDMNVRFHKMKQRYGVDPQYPIKRYVDGLTRTELPDRRAEHDANGNYIGQGKCRNPLFSKNLPKQAADENDPALCNLEKGPRSPDQVFFAVIGGVPQDLLHFDPDSAEKRTLTDEDWVKILGRDPDKHVLAGIDPRMDPSVTPRAGRPAPSPTPGDNEEGGRLRDWDTQGQDLQYACTFPLGTPVQCGASNRETCDCDGSKNPPLCSAATTQSRAKAYPSQRPLRVVHALKEQGIASSICPVTYAPGDKEIGGRPNPLYGYRPAITSMVARLERALAPNCLPSKLARDASGRVGCYVGVSLPQGSRCASYPGLSDAPAERARSGLVECEMRQIVKPPGETCATDAEAGYCYVENTDTRRVIGACAQGIVTTASTVVPPGGFSLQCK